MYIARNGNIKSSTDPDFIHFPDEEKGVLLPSIIGYPDYLPQLQLSPSGRLCFWNFPNKIYKAVCSNPANKGTYQYLRDGKKVTASNPYPPIPVDIIGTNGSNNQYFWNSCEISFVLDATNAALFLQLTQALNPNTVIAKERYAIGRTFTCQPWQMIWMNVQYYIIKYLNQPYSIGQLTPFSDDWVRQFNLASQNGAVQKYLAGCNFLVQPTGGPGFWDKVIAAAPVIIAAAVSIVSLGAGTPSFIAALAGLAASTASKGIIKQDQQGVTLTAMDASRTLNTAAVTTDVSTYSSFWYNATPATKNYIYFGAGILVLLVIYFYYKK